MRVFLLVILTVALFPAVAFSQVCTNPTKYVEPRLKVRSGVALTFDACSGGIDHRILNALVKHDVKATIFVTARWIKRNSKIYRRLLLRKDLFEIANHGERHRAVFDFPKRVYGLRSVGSRKGVIAEVENGAKAIMSYGGKRPKWFRGATAAYNCRALKTVEKLGYKIAGYSVNGDGGARLSAAKAKRNVSSARNGDVVLAHINQPRRSAGRGVVQGILALKKRGVKFVRLSD